jgi:hypothetical protein
MGIVLMVFLQLDTITTISLFHPVNTCSVQLDFNAHAKSLGTCHCGGEPKPRAKRGGQRRGNLFF